MKHLNNSEIEYEIMKIGIVIGNFMPNDDYEDIYKKAKQILIQWDNDFESLPFNEQEYTQEYTQRILNDTKN